MKKTYGFFLLLIWFRLNGIEKKTFKEQKREEKQISTERGR